MFFLNLSLAEFLALAGVASGFVVALYLLDRARRKQVVATLRFWTVVERMSKPKRLLHIRQPWSLLLQLASILLLLLAIAGLYRGSPRQALRDHVLLLDTSAWMGARSSNGVLLDEAKAAARAYVRSLPPTDRVMIVRADALSTPATGFVSDRSTLEQAIAGARAGSTSLHLDDAIQFAQRALASSGRTVGSIVYAGAGRVSREDAAAAASEARVRYLPVGEPAANCGIRKLSIRRSESDPALWEIYVAVRNYGRRQCDAPLTLEFGRALIGTRRFVVAPGEELGTTFGYRTRVAGWIDARLRINDALGLDNYAQVEIPAQPAVRVLVYTEEPGLLRPILAASPNVEAVFASPRSYDPKAEARVVILDRFRPPAPPSTDAIWIEPPEGASPFRLRSTVNDARLERWHGEHPLGSGLRSRDLRLDNAQVFSPLPGDLAVADCAEGPLILARPGQHKSIVLGFHPGRGAARFELATPLLLANLLRWMAPDVFRQWEVNSGSAGMVTAAVDPLADPAQIRVAGDNGRLLPLTLERGSLRFFTPAPGTVQVSEGSRTTVFSLTLPDIADARWEPPAGTPRGLPRAGETGRSVYPVWQYLALAGMLGLFAEWMWFGPRRAASHRTSP